LISQLTPKCKPFPYTTLFRSLRGLVEAAEPLAEAIDGLREPLRSDHPLQGETLGGVRDALQAIADNIGEAGGVIVRRSVRAEVRSEEHTSELQSREKIVCLLL